MDRRGFLGFVSSLALLPPALSLAAQREHSARFISTRVETMGPSSRLLLDIYGKVRYEVFSSVQPPRLIIDLDGIDPELPLQHLDLSGTPVSAIHALPHGSGARLILHLHRATTPQVSLLPMAGGQQLSIDLPHGELIGACHSAARHNAYPRLVKASSHRAAIIAIDPGHGGKDPGAVSSSSHYEKYVALGIAHKLHRLLARESRFKPMMTRANDRFIPLQERVIIAHQHRADMFVSIHADSAPTRHASGASVYALSEHGATSAMARYMATTENNADKYLGGAAFRNKDPALSKLLLDMSMSATINTSLGLGQIMLSNLDQVTRIHQRRVDQAGFAVLKSPDIPSILVENGFMSNPDDCRRLITDRHQQELAESLHASIVNFYRQYPLQLDPTA